MVRKIIALVTIFFSIVWKPVYGQQYSIFESDFVSFSYSPLYYKDVTISSPTNLCGDSDTPCLEAYYIKLNRRKNLGGTKSDSGSVCIGSANDCATQQPDFGYYIDADGGLNVAPPGEKRIFSKLGQWSVVESYPLCGWSDLKSGFKPYGGQCFSVVLMNKSKTVGFTFLLGKAGCKDVLKCWSVEMSRIRRIVGSVK